MKSIDVFGGMTSTIYGTEVNPRLGAIRDPYPHGDVLQNSILRWMFETVQKEKVDTIYGPDPIHSNGRIIEVEDGLFTQRITISGSPVRFLRGPAANADGMVLPTGSALWMISGDCATTHIVDIVENRVAVGHSSLKTHLHPMRKNPGMVDNIMAKFKGSKRENLRAMICFSIQAKHFRHPWNHPNFPDQNREMVEFISSRWPLAVVGEKKLGRISLQVLAASQLREYGISPHHIFFDRIDTYSDQKEGGGSAYWSARRERIEQEDRASWAKTAGVWAPLEAKLAQGSRNAVIVVNHSEFNPNWDWRSEPEIYPFSDFLQNA